jgi:hypothetical protein
VAQTTKSNMLILVYRCLALNLTTAWEEIPALEDRNSDKDATISCHECYCEYDNFLKSWISI